MQSPDAVVVLDPTLLEAVDVTAGLADGGPLIINSADDPGDRPQAGQGRGQNVKVYTVDADTIARECVGRPITNTAMVGALVTVTGILNFDNVRDELRAMFGNRFKTSVVEGNVKALERAYEEVESE